MTTLPLDSMPEPFEVYLPAEDLDALRDLGGIDSQINVAVKIRLKACNNDPFRAEGNGDAGPGSTLLRWNASQDLRGYLEAGRAMQNIVLPAVGHYLDKLVGRRQPKVVPLPLPKKIEPLQIFVTGRDLERLYALPGKPLEHFNEAVRLHLVSKRSRLGVELQESSDDSCLTIHWDCPKEIRHLLPEHAQDASRLVRAGLRDYFSRKASTRSRGVGG